MNHHLATRHGGRRINHYWLVKNMIGNLIEDMLGNWSVARDKVLAVKAKMVKMDCQLNSLDINFAWKCMAGTTRKARHMEGGSDIAIGGRSRDASSVPTHQMVQAASFPILTTIEPMFKHVREDEGPSHEPP